MLLRASLRALYIGVSASARGRGFTAPTAMGKVYAVVVGRKPGVYHNWEQCQAQVTGFPGNRFKGFPSEQEALRYLQDNGVAAAAATLAAGGGQAAGPAAAAAQARPRQAAPSRKRAAPAGAPSAKRKQKILAHAAAAAAGGVARQGAGATAGGGARSATARVLRLEFDGASKRNPGPAGFGAVLYDEATGVEVARLCQYMGDYHTNNQAEYAGLIAGLQAALELGCTHIRVQGDSTLIINQVLGQWQVKNEGLRPYHAAAAALRRRFASFQAQQVLREFNTVADALSNQAIHDYRSGANPHLWTLEAAAAAAQAEAAVEEEDEWAVENQEDDWGAPLAAATAEGEAEDDWGAPAAAAGAVGAAAAEAATEQAGGEAAEAGVEQERAGVLAAGNKAVAAMPAEQSAEEPAKHAQRGGT